MSVAHFPLFLHQTNELMTIQDIKHQFMVYRNGIVADTLRNAGMPYNVIFGLQLPQLSAIAREAIAQNSAAATQQLADVLWTDKKVRESRLLAPYLFDRETISEEKAEALARDVQTVEEADILCFRLLRYLPFADTLAEKLEASADEKVNYCGRALTRNLNALKN